MSEDILRESSTTVNSNNLIEQSAPLKTVRVKDPEPRALVDRTLSHAPTSQSYVYETNVYNEFVKASPEIYLQTADIKKPAKYDAYTTLILAFQSIGVIYGDIGTSPLYVYSSTFSKPPSHQELLGALSLIIWTLTFMVTLKYATFVLQADDNGEGGTFAVYSLLSRYMNISWRDPKVAAIKIQRYDTGVLAKPNRTIRDFFESSLIMKRTIQILSIFGVCFVLADGILTPAQSVLGSIQGLQTPFPNFSQNAIVGITVGILVLLFLVQPLGTSKIGFSFAPIVFVWLLYNLCIGIYQIAVYDHTILSAFSPYWIYWWFANKGTDGWLALGGILLAFTGVEAMFADLGHFSRTAIQISWAGFAYPCLLIAYIGQACYLSVNPGDYTNPFYNAVPQSLFWPSFVLAIFATIVASQAMITGCFSILAQAMSLWNFPPLRVIHTSSKFYGQIYIPLVNWLLMVGTIVVTVAFNNTTSLGLAYGACVVLVSFITTVFITIVSIVVWRWSIGFSVTFFLLFGFIDMAYLTATMTKVPEGAWFTITLAFALASIMILYHWGKEQQWEAEGQTPHDAMISDVIRREEVLINELYSSVVDVAKGTLTKVDQPFTSMYGIGVFFDQTGLAVPPLWSHFTRSFKAVHEIVIFVHVRQLPAPTVPLEERFVWFKTDDAKIFRCIVRQGYLDYERPISKTTLVEALSQRLSDILRKSDGDEAATFVMHAEQRGVSYVLGHTEFAPKRQSPILRRLGLSIFNFIRENSRGAKKVTLGVPHENLIEVSLNYDI